MVGCRSRRGFNAYHTELRISQLKQIGHVRSIASKVAEDLVAGTLAGESGVLGPFVGGSVEGDDVKCFAAVHREGEHVAAGTHLLTPLV